MFEEQLGMPLVWPILGQVVVAGWCLLAAGVIEAGEIPRKM